MSLEGSVREVKINPPFWTKPFGVDIKDIWIAILIAGFVFNQIAQYIKPILDNQYVTVNEFKTQIRAIGSTQEQSTEQIMARFDKIDGRIDRILERGKR